MDNVRADELIDVIKDIRISIHEINMDSDYILDALQGINRSLSILAQCATETRKESRNKREGE